MTLSADEIVERRRLRRRANFWRIASLVILAVLIVSLAGLGGIFDRLSKKGRDHIAEVKISGVITEDEPLLELLEELGEKKQVKAVLLKIDSPGGSTVGGEAIYEAVRELAGKKPVVASVGTLAASAGYMIAAGTDNIVARRSSIVGSIGVLFQYGDASELLDKIGVNVDAIKSSPLKAEPSPFQPASEEVKQMIARVVGDTYDWFVGLVAERRGFDRAKAMQLADGSIFTGAQGLENGLVDRLGDEETARKWLVSEKGISDDLKLVEWKPDRDSDDYLSTGSIARSIRAMIGLETDPAIAKMLKRLEQALFLDGLVSVMQIGSPATSGGSSR